MNERGIKAVSGSNIEKQAAETRSIAKVCAPLRARLGEGKHEHVWWLSAGVMGRGGK